MNAELKAVLGYLPIVCFALAGHLGGPDLVGWFALDAAAATGVVMLAHLGEETDPLEASALVVLSGFAGMALLGGSAGQAWVAEYGFITLQIAIGLVMLVSAVTVPFTSRIARTSVPREYWSSPFFTVVNRRLSAVWAVAVLGGGASRALWLVADRAPGGAGMNILGILLTGVLPIGFVCGAYVITRWTTTHHLRIASGHETGVAVAH